MGTDRVMTQLQPVRLPARVGVIAYLSVLVIFTAIDFVWLTAMADRLYRPVLGDMLAAQPRLVPAILFYLAYAGGLAFLAVRPALLAGSSRMAAVNGSVLGFTAYATYDLTNHATLKNWSAALTLPDLVWGTALSALAAALAFLFTRRFLPAGR
jgi:uncharacterized membrane protein